MKKVKGKYIFLLLICTFILNVNNVSAADAEANARVGTTTSRADAATCEFTYSNGECHRDYDITINMDGKKLPGYCADLNVPLDNYYDSNGLDNKNNYKCHVEENAQIYSILSSNYSQAQKTGALRSVTSDLTTDDPAVNALLNGAGSGGAISLTKVDESNNSITYSATTTLDLSKVTFTCGIGCSNVTVSGKMITVILQPEACSFTFSAKYAGTTFSSSASSGGYSSNEISPGNSSSSITTNMSRSRIIKCENDAGQTVYGAYDDNSSNTTPNNGATNSNNNGNDYDNENRTPGMITQNFSGSLDKCDDEEPNKCKQQTTFEIPDYCDDAADKDIRITAPDDIKYCILNGKDDAGNTYKMSGQGLDDNPYCAVYCKEDYHMTMPGAQYSDSGRYFKLHNTLVEATRTCYTTNPSNDYEKTNIDIQKFVADVIAAQQKMISAADAYQKAVEEKRLSEIAPPQYDKGCNGNKIGPHYTISGGQYDGFEAKCNSTTGVCTPVSKQGSIAKREWGITGSTKDVCSGSLITEADGSSSCTGGSWKCDEEISNDTYDFDAAVATAKSNMDAARNHLIEIIKHMEDCYNWKNELCLDPNVFFQYDEQYSGSINYEKVTTEISNDKNIGYSTEKNIDNHYTTIAGENLEDHHYAYCNESGCSLNNDATYAKKISTLQNKVYHLMKGSEGSAEYANTQAFQTHYPSGTIDTVADSSAVHYNYSYLGIVFPVALNTPNGVYNWTLDFSNLGQYNSEAICRNGRLDTVAKALGKSTAAGVQYVCVYVVDCPDCDYECIDPSGNNCIFPDPKPKCDDCDVYCTNCIFDGEVTYEYRVIGSEVNPNERKQGANWENEKGQTATKEIESNGENVYIEAEYTYVMDASNMKAIRDYNKKTGTYVAEDLTFHTVGNITNAYGTSSFLDNGQKNGFFIEKKRNKNWTQWTNISDNVGPAWK